MNERLSKINTFKMKISDTSEDAFQRAIWRCKTSKVDGTTITWIDIEIPVIPLKKRGGKRIDLLGIDDNGRYVICELKFNNTKNSPRDVVEQINGYQEEIIKPDNASKIQNHKQARLTVNWKKVADKSTRKIIAANEGYWKYWDRDENGNKRQYAGREEGIPSDIECYKLPIKPNHFKDQKGENKTYEPKLEDDKENRWTRVHPDR